MERGAAHPSWCARVLNFASWDLGDEILAACLVVTLIVIII
ncbi:hypothetical protein SAMN04488061_2893 [Filomicrobium insigne]|uniref:Uncharacterized protein n=1 Tax=Filomicrobium insigne TaxID=418854 RepID=A0A1H0SIM6_9HYPH|nr:hypothetical protein SAMN04488061_2893 [Filomicrobium insigne]